MSIEAKAGKDHLKGTALKYPDDFFTLRGERVVPADSFSYYTYEALDGVKDFATNNLSNLFLTKRGLNSAVLENIYLNPSKSITSVKTALQIGNLGHPFNVFFAAKTTKYGGAAEYADIALEQKAPGSTGMFHVSFLSGSKCTVSFTAAAGTYRLDRLDLDTWELYRGLWNAADDEWSQVQDPDGDALCWRLGSARQWDYTLETATGDSGRAHLVLKDGERVVGIGGTGVLTLTLQNEVRDDDGGLSDGQMFTIVLPLSSMDDRILEFPLDESWVSYDNSRITGGIDDGGKRSLGGLPTQLLIHHEYNADGSMNIIPLKGNISYGGNTLRGAYTEGGNDFCFRMYNSITSGFNQERGRDTILLNYTFREQEFLVKPGETHRIDTSFMEEGRVLPIGGTMFVENGAFGSDTPETSDRVVRKTANMNGRMGGVAVPRNASYLCSWLCKKSPEAAPVWLDRYYFPEAIAESDARYGKVENYIHLNHSGDAEML